MCRTSFTYVQQENYKCPCYQHSRRKVREISAVEVCQTPMTFLLDKESKHEAASGKVRKTARRGNASAFISTGWSLEVRWADGTDTGGTHGWGNHKVGTSSHCLTGHCESLTLSYTYSNSKLDGSLFFKLHSLFFKTAPFYHITWFSSADCIYSKT